MLALPILGLKDQGGVANLDPMENRSMILTDLIKATLIGTYTSGQEGCVKNQVGRFHLGHLKALSEGFNYGRL